MPKGLKPLHTVGTLCYSKEFATVSDMYNAELQGCCLCLGRLSTSVFPLPHPLRLSSNSSPAVESPHGQRVRTRSLIQLLICWPLPKPPLLPLGRLSQAGIWDTVS